MIENRNANLRAHYCPERNGCQVSGHSYQTVIAFSYQGDAMVLDLKAGKLIPAHGVDGFVGLEEYTSQTWEAGPA